MISFRYIGTTEDIDHDDRPHRTCSRFNSLLHRVYKYKKPARLGVARSDRPGAADQYIAVITAKWRGFICPDTIL